MTTAVATTKDFALTGRSLLEASGEPRARLEGLDEPEGEDLQTTFNRTLIDSAVRANRAQTPAAAVQKRAMARMSIGEINAVDWDGVLERYRSLPGIDDRPPIVRLLDIIDLPRNAVANAVTATVLPKARELALERGDFDDAGMPKVFASDMLRAMGIKNRIVTSVVGFVGDVAIDPLSWVGAPLGAVAGRTASGARVGLGATGRKAMNRSLKQLRKGETVADDAWRELFSATAEKHGFALTDPGASKKVAGHLLGDPSKGIPRALEIATLTKGGSGGELFEGMAKLPHPPGGGPPDRQVLAAQRVNQRYQRNRGTTIGKKAAEDVGYIPLAHVPLTDITLYAPRPYRTVTIAGAGPVQRAAAATAGGPSSPPPGTAPGPAAPAAPAGGAAAAPTTPTPPSAPAAPATPTAPPPVDLQASAQGTAARAAQYDRDAFEAMMAEARAEQEVKWNRVRSSIGEEGGRVDIGDGRFMIISRNTDPSEAEKYPWRATHFDAKGPSGHTVHRWLDNPDGGPIDNGAVQQVSQFLKGQEAPPASVPAARTAADLQRGVFGQIEEDPLTGRQHGMFEHHERADRAIAAEQEALERAKAADDHETMTFDQLDEVQSQAPGATDDDPFGFADEAAKFTQETDDAAGQAAPGRTVDDLPATGQADQADVRDPGSSAEATGSSGESAALPDRKVRRQQLSKAGLQRRLIQGAKAELPDFDPLANANALLEADGRDLTWSTSFGEIPPELIEETKGTPLRKLLQGGSEKATGADVYATIGHDAYMDTLRAIHESRTKRGGIKSALKSVEAAGDQAHPQLRLMAWLHGALPEKQAERAAYDVLVRPGEALDDGAAFTIGGSPFEVVRDDNGRLKLVGDDLEVGLNDLDDLPIDEGSLSLAGSERVPAEIRLGLLPEADAATVRAELEAAAKAAQAAQPPPAAQSLPAAATTSGGGGAAGGAGGAALPPPPPSGPVPVQGPPGPRTMRVPITRIGRQAEIQRAMGLASQGELHDAGLLLKLSNLVEEMQKNMEELNVLTLGHAKVWDDVLEGKRTRASAQAGLNIVEQEIQKRAAFTELVAQQYKDVRNQIQKGAELYTIEGIGDLMVAARLTEHLDEQLKYVQSMSNFQNAIPSLREIRRAKGVRAGLKVRAGLEAGDTIDDLAPTDIRLQRFLSAAEELVAEQADLADVLYRMSDSSLASAERLAEAYSALMDSTLELAGQARMPLLKVLNDPTQRKLFEVAGELLRTDSTMPFQPLLRVAQKIGPEAEAKVAAWLRAAATNFGGTKGVQADLANRLLAQLQGGGQKLANEMVRNFLYGGGQFTKGLNQIGKSHLGDGWKRHAGELEAISVALGQAKAQAGHPGHWRATMSGHASVPSSIVTWLNNAARRGLTSKAALMDDLSVLADEAGELYQVMGRHMLDERQGGNMLRRGAYFPSSLTPESTNRLRKMKADVFSGGLNAKVQQAREDFQQTRNMTEIRFKLPNGKTRSFLWLERGFLKSLTEDDLVMVGNTHGRRAERELRLKRAVVNYFDTKIAPDVPEEDRIAVWGKPIDPFTMNDRAKNGEYSYLFGGKLISDDMWELTMAESIARRGAAGVIADAKQALVEGVIRPVVLPVPKDIYTSGVLMQPGAKVKSLLGGGVELEVAGNPLGKGESGKVRLRAADGTVYVPIPPAPHADAAFDIYDWLKETGNATGFVPEPLAAAISRAYDAMTPEKIGAVLKAANDVTRFWRASTLAHPSWAVMNALGNAFLMAMAFPTNFPAAFKNLYWAQRAVMGEVYAKAAIESSVWRKGLVGVRENLGKTVLAGEREFTTQDLLDAGRAFNATNSGRALEGIRSFYNMETPPTTTYPGRGGIRGFKERFGLAMAESAVLNTGRPKSYLTDGYDRLRASARSMQGSGAGRFIGEWFRLNGTIDDTFRLAAFKTYLDEGNDIGIAAEKTKEAMLNFGDMSTFEMQWMRTLFPFYSWIKASLPNMVRKLYNEPRYFATLPKLQEALEEAGAGEDALPRHMRPTWIQQQLGIQIGSNPEKAKAFLAGTLIPQEQAMRAVTTIAGAAGAVTQSTLGARLPFAGEAFMDGADFWVSQLTPLLQVPMDLGRGRQGFTGRSIGATQFDGDMSLLGYLGGQVRWANELGLFSDDPGPLARAFDKGVGQGAARFLVAGRLQDISADKVQYSLVREMRDKEESLRRVIRRAEMYDQGDRSREARVELLRVYEEFLKRGVPESEIPKWAREQLVQLAPAS